MRFPERGERASQSDSLPDPSRRPREQRSGRLGPARFARERHHLHNRRAPSAELRPDLILTQKLCDVCAVGYGTVARLAATLPGPPTVVNLEPSSLADILENIRQVAEVCGVPERADTVVAQLSSRVKMVRKRIAQIRHRPRCFLMEWVDPPFCAGHWGPELVEIAGGIDPLGRKHQKSVQIEWEQVLEAQPEVIVLALCGYDATPRGTRSGITPHLSRLRHAPGGEGEPHPCGRRKRLLRPTGSAYCRQPRVTCRDFASRNLP